MSAYAAGRPLGMGLRSLAQAVEIIRKQTLEGYRPNPGTTDGLAERHATAGREGTAGAAAPYPSPRPAPRPAPRPSPSPRPRPSPHPAPAPREEGTAPLPRVAVRPSPHPRPSPYPRPPEPPPAQEPDQAPPEVAEGSTWQLVEQSQTGDAEAFGQLYDRYVDLVHRYIYYRVGDRSTAEDFTSETFLRAWRRIGSVTNQGRDIGAWFITIARNIVLDHVKSSRYRLEVATADMMDADQEEDGPEGAVLDRIASAELLKCVKQLNAEQQECIVLRFLEGLSVAETAAVMGKNEGAIKALQHRAVRRLATLLPEGFR
jgi:RNA polymerase sigma-70 factor (TIGR02952 family)